MRLVSFVAPQGGEADWGVEMRGSVHSARALAPTLDAFVASGQHGLDQLRAVAEAGQLGPAYPLNEVRLRAPLSRPSKIMAIGQNYLDHCRECNAPIPTRPIVFAKFPSSVIGPEDEIRWRADLTSQVDWEVELGVVIGAPARRVPEERALDVVLGYTVVNDVTARDLQRGDGQWVRGKSLDTFCPVGPAIVTADEIPDPQNLGIRSFVNGTVMQDSNTREMIFGVRYLIAFLSAAFTLCPGDLIATGTPHGVGIGRKPPVFLSDGDVVEVEVDGIGRLRNCCRVEG